MSREEILKKIKKNKPSLKELPFIKKEGFSEEIDLKEFFIKNLEAVGGKVIFAESINETLENLIKDYKSIVSFDEKIKIGKINSVELISAKELDFLEAAIIKGQFGIAENGAVWISDKNFSNRVVPFISQNLFLILNENEIVENMHEAYERLSGFNDGYGVFISGPSKTADIEQSLVIGAQGPLSTTVLLIKSN